MLSIHVKWAPLHLFSEDIDTALSNLISILELFCNIIDTHDISLENAISSLVITICQPDRHSGRFHYWKVSVLLKLPQHMSTYTATNGFAPGWRPAYRSVWLLQFTHVHPVCIRPWAHAHKQGMLISMHVDGWRVSTSTQPTQPCRPGYWWSSWAILTCRIINIQYTMYTGVGGGGVRRDFNQHSGQSGTESGRT